jgi:hypothetical protein
MLIASPLLAKALCAAHKSALCRNKRAAGCARKAAGNPAA